MAYTRTSLPKEFSVSVQLADHPVPSVSGRLASVSKMLTVTGWPFSSIAVAPPPTTFFPSGHWAPSPRKPIPGTLSLVTIS